MAQGSLKISVLNQTNLTLLHLPIIGLVVILAGYPAFLDTPWTYGIHAIGGIAFGAVGILISRESRRRLFGFALIASAYLLAIRWVMSWNAGPWPVIGIQTEIFFYSWTGIAILMLDGTKQLTRLGKLTILALVAVGLSRTGLLLLSLPEWEGFSQTVWWPSLYPDKTLFESSLRIAYAFDTTTALLFGMSMFQRLTKIRGIEQHFSLPLALAFASIGLGSAAIQTNQNVLPGPQMDNYYVWTSAIVIGVPIALAVSLFRRNTQHLRIANSLHKCFAQKVAGIEDICNELRTTLRDPTLNVQFVGSHTSESQQFNRKGQLLRTINTRQGVPVAIVTADSVLERHPALVETAINASAIALENARLHDTIREQLAEVEHSRSRIAEAALEERRRIERDLHDGVQQRLLALGTRIGALRNHVDDKTRGELATLSVELADTLTSLRELARGIHPTELTQFGLAASISKIASGLPISSQVHIGNTRYSSTIESTLYFVICEALTNVVKHANANVAHVLITDLGCELVATVSDDGSGDETFEGGTGLIGLRDRVAAVGGSLEINSTSRGTALTVIIPLTSTSTCA